jgi:hypothetical protein
VCLPSQHSSPNRSGNSSAVAGTDGVAPKGVSIDAGSTIGVRLRPAGYRSCVRLHVRPDRRPDRVGDDAAPVPGRMDRPWVMAAMERLVRQVSDRLIGLELGDIAVDAESRRRPAVVSSPRTALRSGQAGRPTLMRSGRRPNPARQRWVDLVRGVHQGTRDIIRDAKWCQPAGFQARGGGGGVNRVAGRGQMRQCASAL